MVLTRETLLPGLVASIRHEDGKLDLYDYSLVSNLWVETVTHLHEQSPSPVSGKTTRDITTTNARGEVVETRTEAYIDGMWYTISRNRMTYNEQGKRIRSENLVGQVTTTAWDCCHKVSETYPVRYTYDIFGNKTTMTTYRDETSRTGGSPVQDEGTFSWSYLPGSDLKSSLSYPSGYTSTCGYFCFQEGAVDADK